MQSENQNNTNIARKSGFSPHVIVGMLALIVIVSLYMITGGLAPSGAPIKEAPVAAPANPER